MNFLKQCTTGLGQFAVRQFIVNAAVDIVGTFAPSIANLYTRPITAIRALIGGK